jgi:hypothetical protein
MPSPTSFSLFCKTYAGDLRRLARLIESVEKHNIHHLPMVVSTPRAEHSLFVNTIGAHRVQFVFDEDIICAQPKQDGGRYALWDGRLSQQVIKAEFWRLGLAETWLCLDSDSEFIRDFSQDDFICPMSGTPFTVITQAKELRQLADNRGIPKVRQHFLEDAQALQQKFGRKGPAFEFSPTPVVWSAKVWRDLDEGWLAPQGLDFWDAIEQHPSELRWYGEALLRFRSIDLIPIEPLFRVYHYDWHYARLRALGECRETLSHNYLGVVMQSNWDKAMDSAFVPRKNLPSRLARSLRRLWSRWR